MISSSALGGLIKQAFIHSINVLTWTLLLSSIEEDFVTWKENLWPSVCQRFGIDSSEQRAIVREYQFTVHTDMPSERIFEGEPHRLGSYENQKPWVRNLCVMFCEDFLAPSGPTMQRTPSCQRCR